MRGYRPLHPAVAGPLVIYFIKIQAWFIGKLADDDIFLINYNLKMKTILLENLEAEIRKELDEAEEAAKKAYPRDRDVRIGVVLVADGDKKFEGANVVRERFVGSSCAERMALDKALFAGIKKIERLIIIGENNDCPFEEVIAPCGNCRQMLFDTLDDLEQSDIEIILSNSDKSKIVKTSLLELLPLAYKSNRNNA